MKKPETRIIPEETNSKFFSEHLKPYEFLRQSAAGKKILDLGCGDGYGSFYLAQVAGEVFGIDYEEDVVALTKAKYVSGRLSFQVMDATDLQFADSTFDMVCSFQVIEHMPEVQLLRYLSEVRRVLKKDGQFYLSTLNLKHVMKGKSTYQKNPAHVKEFTLEELSALLSQIFSCVKIYGLHLTLRHSFYHRLKKTGIFTFLPTAINPVNRFYNKVTTDDFKITPDNLEKAIDFICLCKNV